MLREKLQFIQNYLPFSHRNKASVSAGEAIYSEGETPKAMYVVKSGEIELKVRGKSLEVVGADGRYASRFQ
ncbi:MAG: cyclic nucleotide-binding domain-containing protein [Verrucomicrobia bacterium]|nr:cyclic nucleotide-binding domain-containing protein [Verrucomicrobiota bacterium]